jgi:hypothetical protein
MTPRTVSHASEILLQWHNSVLHDTLLGADNRFLLLSGCCSSTPLLWLSTCCLLQRMLVFMTHLLLMFEVCQDNVQLALLVYAITGLFHSRSIV